MLEFIKLFKTIKAQRRQLRQADSLQSQSKQILQSQSQPQQPQTGQQRLSRRHTRLEDVVNFRPASLGLLSPPPSPSLYTYIRGDINHNDIYSGMTLRNRSGSTDSASLNVGTASRQSYFLI